LARAGPDVVLAQHLEHPRAREPRDARGREEPERDRRQDEVLEAAAARGGQQVELHREDEDQHDPSQNVGIDCPSSATTVEM
jgi:hypothetical protein